MRALIRWVKDNSLSIVLTVLFVICLVGQCFASWRLRNETLTAQGRATIGFWRNLVGGTFLEGLSSNWQAAFLQLASLILFSGFLIQRGAAHSRDPLKLKDEREHRLEATRYSWVYRNSLFLAFLVLFLISMVMHVAFGLAAHNEERALTGHPPISISSFLVSAKFWSSTLQTWQAEYLAIALFVVFSIFLRQQDSAESKPLEASNEATGKENN